MSSKGKPRNRTVGRAKTRRRSGDFDSEFDLHDTLGRETRHSGILHHQRETAWQGIYASRKCKSGHRSHCDLCDPGVTVLPHSVPR